LLNFLSFAKIVPLTVNLALYFRKRPLRRKVTPFTNPTITPSLHEIPIGNEGEVVKTRSGNALVVEIDAVVRVIVVVEIDEAVRGKRVEVEELGNQSPRESLRRSRRRVDLLRQRFQAPHSMWAHLDS